MSDRALGALAAGVAAALFGSAYVATALQLHEIDPLGGALWRSAISATILVAVAVASALGRRGLPEAGPAAPPLLGRLGRLIVIGVVGGLVFAIGMNVAVSRIGATVTSFVAGLYAILAALFAPIVLGERLERRAVVGFLVALLGTALLAELAPSPGVAGGLVAGGVAAVGFGLYLVLVRRWSATIRVGPVGIALANAGCTAVGLVVIVAVLEPGAAVPAEVTAEFALATAWLVLVTVVAQLLVAAALRRIEARLASSMLLINPITATVLAALLAGERPSPPQLVGGLLVLVGMATSADLPGAVRRRREVARSDPDLPPA